MKIISPCSLIICLSHFKFTSLSFRTMRASRWATEVKGHLVYTVYVAV